MEIPDGTTPYEVGLCTVSIPPDHDPGIVERPNYLRLELTESTERHFVLTEVSPTVESVFFATLNKHVRDAPDRDLFVFVHGFNNSFEDAAFRTAQIAKDLEFKGAPIFFSWPSQKNVALYSADENNVQVSVDHLRHFLDQVRARSGAVRIHLVAHSMGNRALTRALRDIVQDDSPDGPIFDELILAAPDIDVDEFRQVADYLTRAADRVTLYASSEDEALKISRNFHGGEHPRAGESRPHPVVVDDVETVDVSEVTTSHAYIADNEEVLDDVGAIITRHRRLSEEIARSVWLEDDKRYWVLLDLRARTDSQ